MVYITSYLIKNLAKSPQLISVLFIPAPAPCCVTGMYESQARRINQFSIWINSHELPRTVTFISGESGLCRRGNIKGQFE